MSWIDDKYDALGGADGFLGYPLTDERPTPNGLGSYRHYEGGSIYSHHQDFAAFEVHGAIRHKWASLGWENSFLGFPVSDEFSPVPGHSGRSSRFEGGTITWTPQIGAHEVHGAIYTRWTDLGQEQGVGFALTDELTTPDGQGRFNHFERGSIYWTRRTGAHEVKGGIKDAWARSGWERGLLGYPIAPPDRIDPAGRSATEFQDFEHGSIYQWAHQSRIVTRNPAIVALSGIVLGWNDLAQPLPDGDVIRVEFSGHSPNRDVKLTLRAAPPVTWWKAVSLWSPTHGDMLEIWTQDGRNESSVTIPPADLVASELFLQFKKAKFAGVHTGMYWLVRPDRMIGNDVTLTWMQD